MRKLDGIAKNVPTDSASPYQESDASGIKSGKKGKSVISN